MADESAPADVVTAEETAAPSEAETAPVDVVDPVVVPESTDPVSTEPEAAATSPTEVAASRAAALAAHFASQQTGIEEENKRKYDGAGDEPTAKRAVPDTEAAPQVAANPTAAVSTPAAAAAGPAGQVTRIYQCPSDKVGKVIGRAGITIQELQANTSTRIQIDHSVGGDLKPMTIVGSTAAAVELALKGIKEILESDAPSSIPGDVSKVLDCPQGIVGRIIGRGGETIRSLQTASGAHIAVDQNFPDGEPRKITITGKAENVARAHSMVEELVRGEPGSASAVVQKFGLGVTRTFDCPKTMVGRVIGRGGDTIKSLQKNYSCSIQIDQNSTPCKITVTGPASTMGAAEREILALIHDAPMPHGGGGGGGHGMPPYGHGGGHGGPGYGGGPGRPFYQPPAAPYASPYAAGPYGGFPPAAAPYGAYPVPPAAAYGGGYPGAYGAPPVQQPYGGGGYGGGYGGAPADPYAGAYGHQQQQAAAPAPAPTPSLWQELHDSEGRSYYYHSQTGVSQWEKPADM